MVVVKSVNLALRFCLELAALTALGYWGFTTGRGLLVKSAMGLGAPLLAAVIWGAFVAPKASMLLPLQFRLIVELAVFGSATAALFASGQPGLARAFGLTVLLNMVLMNVWKQ